jgi:hypothetical protein
MQNPWVELRLPCRKRDIKRSRRGWRAAVSYWHSPRTDLYSGGYRRTTAHNMLILIIY